MKPLIQYTVFYKLSEMNSFLKGEEDNTVNAAESCTWQDDILGLSDWLNEHTCFLLIYINGMGLSLKRSFPGNVFLFPFFVGIS